MQTSFLFTLKDVNFFIFVNKSFGPMNRKAYHDLLIFWRTVMIYQNSTISLKYDLTIRHFLHKTEVLFYSLSR